MPLMIFASAPEALFFALPTVGLSGPGVREKRFVQACDTVESGAQRTSPPTAEPFCAVRIQKLSGSYSGKRVCGL